MRVLFLARLFGGLKAGLAKGEWQPAGVPAIYRLLEGLASDRDVELLTVFCVKEADARFSASARQKIPVIGDTMVLPYRQPFGAFVRANAAANELMDAARILALAARVRPEVVYATYANILPAALLARAGHRGVVVRLMGVQPHHRQIAADELPLFRWIMRSPFAHVVCTEDGSDPGAVLPRILSPATPWTVRLNGCDTRPLSLEQVRVFRSEVGLGARPVILFLARLEPYKGCFEFIDAVTAVLREEPDTADVIVVGDGPLRQQMESRVAQAGVSERVRFVGSQPHARVNEFLNAADIYVSTNMYGNLSNANLEALAAGSCLVLPTSDESVPLDTVTDRLVGADIAARYDRKALPQSLAATLRGLLRTPQEIAARRARTADLARNMIRPWAEVVQGDIALLKSVAARHRPAPVPTQAN